MSHGELVDELIATQRRFFAVATLLMIVGIASFVSLIKKSESPVDHTSTPCSDPRHAEFAAQDLSLHELRAHLRRAREHLLRGHVWSRTNFEAMRAEHVLAHKELLVVLHGLRTGDDRRRNTTLPDTVYTENSRLCGHLDAGDSWVDLSDSPGTLVPCLRMRITFPTSAPDSSP